MSMRTGGIAVLDPQQLAETAKEALDLWRLWLVRGVLAILFGIAAWAWPGLTSTTLIWLIGAYIIVDGVMSAVGFFRHQDLSWGRRILLLLWGAVEVIAGIVIWFTPGLGVVTTMVVFGGWAMLTGMFLLVGAFTKDGHPRVRGCRRSSALSVSWSETNSLSSRVAGHWPRFGQSASRLSSTEFS